MNRKYGFICPVCHAKGQEELLKTEEHTVVCPQRHSFDRAKSGYVNLLMPGDKHSKMPGDNQLMVAARQKFLNTGYYQPLADAVGQLLIQQAGAGCQSLHIADAGCGEGYYTAHVRKMLMEQGISVRMLGVDISKTALDKAAKRDQQTEFAVASIFHLPLGSASCDVLLNLFAPFCAEEMQRVLRPGGWLLMVSPGKRHLLELKSAVYDEPYANEIKEESLEGFELAVHKNLEYPMVFSKNEDIMNLFQMTPYYYKTSQKNQQRLLNITELTVTASFEILLYKKCESGKD